MVVYGGNAPGLRLPGLLVFSVTLLPEKNWVNVAWPFETTVHVGVEAVSVEVGEAEVWLAAVSVELGVSVETGEAEVVTGTDVGVEEGGRAAVTVMVADCFC